MCRCGHPGQATDAYCGQCGRLLSEASLEKTAKPVSAPTGKYDLERLLARIPKESARAEAAGKAAPAHLNQDEIRKLVTVKKKQKA